PQPVGTAVTTAIVKHPKRKEGHEPDYSYHARGTPGNRERERLADTGGADPAEKRTRQPHAGCGCGGARTARVPDFKGPPLQADRQGGCAVPQVREQAAVLPQGAAVMG